MNMNKLSKLLAALALAPVLANAAPPPLVDSTGVKKSVVSTIVMPAAGLTESNVKTIIENRDFNGGGSSIPPGYTEIQVPMGPHFVATPYTEMYYLGLGYPVVAWPTTDPFQQNDPCLGNYTSPPRLVMGGGGEACTESSCTTTPVTYFVCEPVGVRYSLQKIVGGDTLAVTRPMLDTKTIAPAIGMSTNAATAFCQYKGYTNYVPNTVLFTQPGTCDQSITRWNGSIFYNDTACHNTVLQSMTCFR